MITFLRLKIFFIAALAVVFLNGCTVSSGEEVAQDKPLNVILLIGDGMGLSQVSSSFFFNDEKPNFERFKHIGLIKTSSSSHKITDSAAGATAFSCGEKTYNGAIGVDKDGNSLKSIVEILEGKNYRTGLISTSSVTHATPASFYAEASQRSQEELIASQMHTSGVDFFAGGGLDFFKKRKDNFNYIDSLLASGYEIETGDLPDAGTLEGGKKYGFLLAGGAMPRMTQGRGDFLKIAANRAIDFLSKSEDGFFLMIEGSQIDWGGHENNSDYLISELVDFDKTIGAVLDFAKKDGNTLVVVTADHETGGFTLASGTSVNKEGKKHSDYNKIDPSFSTGGHSSALIPVFAYGPGAENFAGIYENTGIFHKILSETGK